MRLHVPSFERKANNGMSIRWRWVGEHSTERRGKRGNYTFGTIGAGSSGMRTTLFGPDIPSLRLHLLGVKLCFERQG